MARNHDRFKEQNTALVAISVDSLRRNRAMVEELNLTFPVLSDRERTVCRTYGVLDASGEVPRVAFFVIDARGFVRWSLVTEDFTISPIDDQLIAEIRKLKQSK